MSPDLQRLIDLQRLETTIADAKATIAAHPQRLADADAQLAAATQMLDAAKNRLKDNQDARRALEKDVALYQGRLAKFKDQQSAVKTNKEYQALGHEIETAQRDLGGVEGPPGGRARGRYVLTPIDGGKRTQVTAELYLDVVGAPGVFVRNSKIRDMRQAKLRADIQDVLGHFASRGSAAR